MAVRWLRRSALRAPVPVYAIAGIGGREAVQALRLNRDLQLVDTPRHASVLLVVGAVGSGALRPLAQVHDQLPHPRGLVWCTQGSKREISQSFPDAVVCSDPAPVAAAVRRCHRDLLTAARESARHVLPDRPPTPWKGVGPHGQGGEGMMGGTPYGRPMAMTGEDRDGLALDRLELRLGPFLPSFPLGLVLDVTLQGDVVQEATLGPNPFSGARFPVGSRALREDPFDTALAAPVSIAELERHRALSHLRWLADFLHLQGLEAYGRRALRLAAELTPDSVDDVVAFGRALEGPRALNLATAGVGRVGPEALAGSGLGPVARAAGLAEDERSGDPAYRRLGFEPLVSAGGDALARWRQRIGEAQQSLRLAAQAGPAARTEPRARVEAVHGLRTPDRTPERPLLDLLPACVTGLEWNAAVTTIASLDLDLQQVAVAAETVG